MSAPMLTSLTSMFNPRSVAIIGASDKPHRIGFQVVKSLNNGGFAGSVYPINPRLRMLLDRPVYASIDAVPDGIDLVIIALRKERVLKAVEACGQKGVQSIIIMSSGFSELGDAESEEELTGRVRKYGMRMLGPNCAGFVATWEQVYASFENRIQKGHLAFITQSGAMSAVVLALAQAEQLGLSMFISYGNAADVGPEEILQYLGRHKPTQLIGCYLEGVQHARSFLAVARSITKHKPIIVLKPGDTPAAVRAIQSHTGALAGDQALYAGAFRQAGLLQTHTLDEFIDACKVLSTQPLPIGNRVGIITNSGGPGVLAVDACARAALNVPRFKSSLVQQLTTFLPSFSSLENPVDVGPEGDNTTYKHVVELLLANADLDIVLVICVPPVFADLHAITRAVIEAKNTYPTKPMVTCWMAGAIVAAEIPLLTEAGIPNFPTPQRAATALQILVQRARWLAQPTTKVIPSKGTS